MGDYGKLDELLAKGSDVYYHHGVFCESQPFLSEQCDELREKYMVKQVLKSNMCNVSLYKILGKASI